MWRGSKPGSEMGPPAKLKSTKRLTPLRESRRVSPMSEYTSKQRVVLKQDPYRIYYITAVLELDGGGVVYEMVSEDDDKIGRIQWGSDIKEVVRNPEVGDVYVNRSMYNTTYYFVQGVSGDEVTYFSTASEASERSLTGTFLVDLERVG